MMLKTVPDPPHNRHLLDGLLMPASHDALCSDVAHQRLATALLR